MSAQQGVVRGHPLTALVPEVEELFLKALRLGNTVTCSADLAGVHRSTVTKWLRRGRRELEEGRETRYTAFVAAYKKAMAEAEARHVANIARAASEGQWVASAWWLERRRPHDYARKDHVTLGGDKARPVVFEMTLPPIRHPRAGMLNAGEDEDGITDRPAVAG